MSCSVELLRHAQVTEAGDLIYELPSSFRAKLVATSARLRADVAARAAGTTAIKAGKVTFGVMLIASVVVCSIAVVAALTALATQSASLRHRRRHLSYWARLQVSDRLVTTCYR
jgi:hypothetical protein